MVELSALALWKRGARGAALRAVGLTDSPVRHTRTHSLVVQIIGCVDSVDTVA